jgi:uncharacterized membrane protein
MGDNNKVIKIGSGESEERNSEPLSMGKRILWIIIAVFSFAWIFIPEFTDLIPVIGWIDEGIAIVIFFTSLSKLGYNIPIINKIFSFFYGRKSMNKMKNS